VPFFFKLPVLQIYEFDSAQNCPDHSGSKNFIPVNFFQQNEKHYNTHIFLMEFLSSRYWPKNLGGGISYICFAIIPNSYA